MTTITFTFCFLTLTVYASQASTTVTFPLVEEQKSGTEVGDLTTVDLNATAAEKAGMRYDSLTTDYNHLFSIHETSGKLFTMVAIDRESVCAYLPDCVLELIIAARSGTFFQEITVKIVIEDINDNKPLFPEESMELPISEGVSINSAYPIKIAQDKDTGENNGIQSYEIIPVSDMFGLLPQKNSDGIIFSLKLFVKKALDRETQSMYKVTVVAKDGGNPIQSGSMTVSVIVTDTNDNAPEFTKSLYNITVEEDTEASTVILKLNATDLDSGDNGMISYRIMEQQADAAEILHYFMMDSSTGELILKNQLVYEEGQFFKFTVEALDNGEQPMISQAEVLVYVKDAKNNAPVIKISFLPPGNIGFANVSEKAEVGTFVAYVNVDDTDSGANGDVSCSISNALFAIQSGSSDNYIIKVNSVLNREMQDLHNVTVHCEDKGNPPLGSSESFLVRVTDYNDNKPVFESGNYYASIYENTMTEKIVLQVSATDKDLGKNKDIHYAIRNEDKIKINQNSGIISVLPYFDREKTPLVVFNVLAIDQGDIPLTGTATVTLTVKDRNDNKPQFNYTEYKFEITENIKSGFSVGQLSAYDLDINENGKLIFSLAPADVERKIPFTVFSNGIIKSNRELDREKQSRYTFNVLVTDQGEPKLSSAAPVTVDVNDINDNAPNITFPGKSNRTITMLYPVVEMELHEPVSHIEAYDIDKAENKTLKYSILDGNELGIFVIEEGSGKIYVNDNRVQIENDMTVTLIIEVRDKGVKSKASTERLIVNLIYSNATYVDASEGDNKYIVISAVVVVVTVLISAIIIFVIFLLRNLDKKRKGLEEQLQADTDCGFENKPSLYIINTTAESSTDTVSASTENSRKKKEVSFSFDDQNSFSGFTPEFKVSANSEPVQKAPEKPPRSDNPDSGRELYDRVTTRLESLKLQQYILESKEKQQQLNQHIHPDDSRSESSGETSSGDSGRGNSEEDASTSPTDERKEFIFPYGQTYSIPNKYSTSDNLSVIVPRGLSQSPAPPPIPCRTYKTNSLNNNYKHRPDIHQYLSEPAYSHDSSVLDISSQSWQHQPHFHYPTNSAQVDFLDIASLPKVFSGSVKSRDDDDCSTTTSGSYTIYSEDLL